MVQFKIYDKNLKKFVDLALVGDKVLKYRRSLGILHTLTHNWILPQSLEKMYKLMKRTQPHLKIYVKVDNRYKPISNEIIKKVMAEHKLYIKTLNTCKKQSNINKLRSNKNLYYKLYKKTLNKCETQSKRARLPAGWPTKSTNNKTRK
jgi:hypothetical protein